MGRRNAAQSRARSILVRRVCSEDLVSHLAAAHIAGFDAFTAGGQ